MPTPSLVPTPSRILDSHHRNFLLELTRTGRHLGTRFAHAARIPTQQRPVLRNSITQEYIKLRNTVLPSGRKIHMKARPPPESVALTAWERRGPKPSSLATLPTPLNPQHPRVHPLVARRHHAMKVGAWIIDLNCH
jgi:hypothetical protein